MPKTLATATVDRLLHHAHVLPNLRRFNPPQPGPRRKRSHADELNPLPNMANATKHPVGGTVSLTVYPAVSFSSFQRPGIGR